MNCLFCVISFVDSNSQIGLVGSHSALGNWNPQKAILLNCQSVISNLVPSFWSCSVSSILKDLTLEEIKVLNFEYKFIRWNINTPQQIEWEGSGNIHNRKWIFNEDQLEKTTNTYHTKITR